VPGDLRPEWISESGLRLSVLGSFRVDRDGVEVDPGPRLQRMLLAILVVEAGHVVPVDRLVDLLWREEPPAAAMASVQAYVSQLRRLLEPGRPARALASVLVTQDPGYLLRVDDEQVDAMRFQALARQAHSDLAGDQPAAAPETAAAAPGHAGAPSATPQPTPGPPGPSLIGRDGELAHLRGRLRQVASGHGGAVVLVGEPGADLTRQAAEAVVIDAAGTIAVPGFVDAHVHAWEGQLRGTAPTLDFGGYLALATTRSATG
jgi:DNA-binding winged helix-turn-helix (wHTH) protein